MKYKILSMGTMYLDINCTDFPYDENFAPNKEVVGKNYEMVPGGSALIFARVAASLGLAPVFVGKVGKDMPGALLKDILKKSKVSLSLIESDSVQTNLGINFIGSADSSVMASVGSANQSLKAREVEERIEKLSGSVKYLYLGGSLKLRFLLPRLKAIAANAKRRGVKVILDHGRVTNRNSQSDLGLIRSLVPLVDFYFPSRDEFLQVWNTPTIESGIKKVSKITSALIAVKNAQKGAAGFDGRKILRIPAFRVSVRNTVGAGDSFNAGFIKAQDMKMTLKGSLRFAGATAALKISQKELPTPQKIRSFLNNKQ